MKDSRNKTKAEAHRSGVTVKMDDFTKSFVNSLSNNIKESVQKDMNILRKHNILSK